MTKNLLFTAALFFSIGLTAQTTHTVTVQNGSFSPSSLTIDVGDIVKWDNVQGTHWVDGKKTSFPNNPVGFDNESQSGTGWSYSETFNTAGSYSYKCGIHSSMTGTITVDAGNPVLDIENEESTVVGFYPNPAQDKVSITGLNMIQKVEAYNLSGQKIAIELNNNTVSLKGFASGVYQFSITDENGKVHQLRLLVE